MGLQPGDEVLLPAYHCVSMIEPVLRAAARPIFYRVNPDTRIDLEDFQSRAGPRTRAAVVPHYFGFHQRIEEIRAICDQLGMVLIEDCAHSFFGSINGSPVGSFGHLAIASPWKFLPVMEGGCLIVNDITGKIPSFRSPGIKAEVKSLLNNMERSIDHRRLRAAAVVFSPLIRLTGLRTGNYPVTVANPDPRIANAVPIAGIRASTRVSRFIIKHTDLSRAVHRRLSHYFFLDERFSQLQNAEPLHRLLPEGVVPQVYPLRMHEPEVVFPRLLEAGVPVIRFGEYLWEGMDPDFCSVTRHLSRTVFQIPCHQDMTCEEIKWLAEVVCRITDGLSS